MNEHISFDDLQEFVYANKLTPALIRLGAKINSHVLVCTECAEQYDALLELREKTQHLSQSEERSTQQSLQDQRDLIESQMTDNQKPKEQSRARSQSNDIGITRQ